VLNAGQKAGNHYRALKEAFGVVKPGGTRRPVKVLFPKFSGTGKNKPALSIAEGKTKNKYRQV